MHLYILCSFKNVKITDVDQVDVICRYFDNMSSDIFIIRKVSRGRIRFLH